MFLAPPIDLEFLPELDSGQICILWVNDWYDGPLEALAEYRAERCLLVIHDPGAVGTNDPWRWVLFRLTQGQLADEEYWHRLFVKHVGAHWDWTGTQYPEPSGQSELFYGEYAKRPRLDLSQCEPIGWIAEMPGRKGQTAPERGI